MQHAVVAFLENDQSLVLVDEDLRELVGLFHRIPFCATLGVSCAGHLKEDTHWANGKKQFWPALFGDLCIIVLPEKPHIKNLINLIGLEIQKHKDVTIGEIEHLYGPSSSSPLKVFEIFIKDANCFGKGYEGFDLEWFAVDGNEELYEKALKRYNEIKLFWQDLIKIVKDFCEANNFSVFDLLARKKELVACWNVK